MTGNKLVGLVWYYTCGVMKRYIMFGRGICEKYPSRDNNIFQAFAGNFYNFVDVNLCSAMGPTEGGNNLISVRLVQC